MNNSNSFGGQTGWVNTNSGLSITRNLSNNINNNINNKK
jgi:hypothetical protein